MILLDTTVLVYAVGGEHRYRDPSRRLLTAVADGALEATTTVEVVQEFAYVRSRRFGRASAVSIARDHAALLSPLVVTAPDDLALGLGIFEQSDGLGCFDSVLAAVALNREAAALVSADRAFGLVDGLTVVVPDDPGVAALLGSAS